MGRGGFARDTASGNGRQMLRRQPDVGGLALAPPPTAAAAHYHSLLFTCVTSCLVVLASRSCQRIASHVCLAVVVVVVIVIVVQADMIINGILPLEQMRDYLLPCAMITRRIPR